MSLDGLGAAGYADAADEVATFDFRCALGFARDLIPGLSAASREVGDADSQESEKSNPECSFAPGIRRRSLMAGASGGVASRGGRGLRFDRSGLDISDRALGSPTEHSGNLVPFAE